VAISPSFSLTHSNKKRGFSPTNYKKQIVENLNFISRLRSPKISKSKERKLLNLIQKLEDQVVDKISYYKNQE